MPASPRPAPAAPPATSADFQSSCGDNFCVGQVVNRLLTCGGLAIRLPAPFANARSLGCPARPPCYTGRESSKRSVLLIPFLDLKAQYYGIKDEIDSEIGRAHV